MSYEQIPTHYVGQHFESNDTLIAFLLKHQALSPTLINNWSSDLNNGEHLTNLLSPSDITIANFPELFAVDTVSGDGGMILGYIIESKLVSAHEFKQNTQKAQAKWKTIFNEEATLNLVMRYI